MSRCFPFPPPGYDKKIQTDVADLLAKEKHKEKKRKRGKKEKGIKDDLERVIEKSKRRKEKREKHRDKKDKNKDKEQNGVSDIIKADATEKGLCSSPKGLQKNSNGDSKHIEELTRRLRDEEKATTRHNIPKIKNTGQKNGEFPGKLEASWFPGTDGRYNQKEKNETIGQINDRKELLASKNANISVSQKRSRMKHKTLNGIVKAMETKKIHQNWRVTKIDKAGGIDGDGGYRTVGGKTFELKKMGKEQFKFMDGENKAYEEVVAFPDTQSIKQQDHLTDKILSGVGNHGKRKHLEVNRSLNENEGKGAKLQKLASCYGDNGTKLEAQTLVLASDSSTATQNNCRSSKEQRISYRNGHEEPEILVPNSCPAMKQVTGKSSGPSEPPHPDAEYLAQILIIPRVDDMPVLDDQDWLQGRNTLQLKSPPAVPWEIDGRIRELWDKALRIESADILAFPYVIPY